MDHFAGKSWRADDLYGEKKTRDRFEFLCYLNSTKDLSVILGYRQTMAIVLQRHPSMKNLFDLLILRHKRGVVSLAPFNEGWIPDYKPKKFSRNGHAEFEKQRIEALRSLGDLDFDEENGVNSLE